MDQNTIDCIKFNTNLNCINNVNKGLFTIGIHGMHNDSKPIDAKPPGIFCKTDYNECTVTTHAVPELVIPKKTLDNFMSGKSNNTYILMTAPPNTILNKINYT